MDVQPSRLTHTMNRHSDGDQRVKRKRGRGQDRPHLQAIVGGVNGAVRYDKSHLYKLPLSLKYFGR